MEELTSDDVLAAIEALSALSGEMQALPEQPSQDQLFAMSALAVSGLLELRFSVEAVGVEVQGERAVFDVDVCGEFSEQLKSSLQSTVGSLLSFGRHYNVSKRLVGARRTMRGLDFIQRGGPMEMLLDLQPPSIKVLNGRRETAAKSPEKEPAKVKTGAGWYGAPVEKFMDQFADDDEANMKKFIGEWNRNEPDAKRHLKYKTFRSRVSEAKRQRTPQPVHKKTSSK